MAVDYPRTWAEFVAWFPDDAACVAYLVRAPLGGRLRVPGMRLDPVVAGEPRPRLESLRTVRETHVGHRRDHVRRYPYPADLSGSRAAWHVCSTKNGASALGLQKLLGLGSYETAWAWLHKLRRAMVIPGRDLLTGDVEVDETFVGGDEPGLTGGRARGKKVLVAVAVECRGSRLGSNPAARASPTPAAARCTSSSPAHHRPRVDAAHVAGWQAPSRDTIARLSLCSTRP